MDDEWQSDDGIEALGPVLYGPLETICEGLGTTFKPTVGSDYLIVEIFDKNKRSMGFLQCTFAINAAMKVDLIFTDVSPDISPTSKIAAKPELTGAEIEESLLRTRKKLMDAIAAETIKLTPN